MINNLGEKVMTKDEYESKEGAKLLLAVILAVKFLSSRFRIRNSLFDRICMQKIIGKIQFQFPTD